MALADTSKNSSTIFESPPHKRKTSSGLHLNLGARIILSISLAVSVVSIVIFFWIYAMQQRQVMGQVETEAKSLITSMVLMREWVANYGGVWANQPGEVYLKEENGYYLKTPAMVTKELSILSDKKASHTFHITSEKLKNPDNAPLASERTMLQNFETGHPVFGQVEQLDGERVYHYMAPLTVEGPCMECHADQGYQVGDLRGGLSVFLPMDKVDNALAQNRWTLIFSAATIILLLISLYLLVRRLIVAPIGQLEAVTMAVGEGNYNARCCINTGDELESLGDSINHMITRLETSHTKLESKVQQRTSELGALSEVTFSISRTQNLHEALNEALESIFKVTPAESGAIHLIEENSEKMQLFSYRELPFSVENCLNQLELGECVPGQVAANKVAIHHLDSKNCYKNGPCKQGCPLGEANWHLISAPLKSREQTKGVITLITRRSEGFSDETAQLLECVGHQLGVAVENAQLHKQAGQMAILEERNRLARELHDNLGQTIGYLNFNTRIVDSMLQSGQYNEARKTLSDMGNSTKQAYDDVRWAIFDLHAPGDNEQDFQTALQTYLEEFEVQTGLNCYLKVSEKTRLSPDVQVQLVRIVQEAMHNVRKHAQAKEVWVTFNNNGVTAQLNIEDNGIGIENNRPDPSSHHYGLHTMRERALSIGWKLQVKGRKSGGTRVLVQLNNEQ